jgi:hypothetical protein
MVFSSELYRFLRLYTTAVRVLFLVVLTSRAESRNVFEVPSSLGRSRESAGRCQYRNLCWNPLFLLRLSDFIAKGEMYPIEMQTTHLTSSEH